MRELTINELNIVSGGYTDPNLGDKLKNSKYPVVPALIVGASNSVKVIKAGVIGYKIGEALNEYTPIQDWIGKGTDKLIDYQMKKQQSQTKDKSGNNYGH